jgi:gliding motility-associated-like protein
MTVYNRLGQSVFETNNVNIGWDGTWNGIEQPLGVYAYSIKGLTNDAMVVELKGNVTLLR